MIDSSPVLDQKRMDGQDLVFRQDVFLAERPSVNRNETAMGLNLYKRRGHSIESAQAQ